MNLGFSDPNRTRTVATGVAIFLIVPILAALSAFVGPYSLLPYIAIVGSIAVFSLPLDVVLIATFLSASVLAGILEYFGGVSQGFWLPYLLSALLALRGFGERLRPKSTEISNLSRLSTFQTKGLSVVQLLAFLYVSIAFFGLSVALPPMSQVIVGTKNYFFIWGVLLVLIWSPWEASSSQRFWTTVVAIACLQWPFTLYQRFVIAARRHDNAAWDSVVGTLGGDPTGGGNSAAMAFLCCIAVAVLGLRMRDRQLKILPGTLLLCLCLLPIALAEVKAAFIWLVIVFVILTARQFIHEPMRAITTVLIGGALMTALGITYVVAYKDQMGSGSSLESIYDKQIKYSIDPNEFSSQYKRLGRVTSLVYWWQHHDMSADPVNLLFGHGLGSSRSVSSLGVSELARRLPYAVDGTAASALLWDIGLLGAITFTAMLVAAAIGTLRLSRKPHLHQASREACLLSGVVLSMTLTGLLYNKDALDNATVQLLVMFSMAQFLIFRKWVDPESTTKPGTLTPMANQHFLHNAQDLGR